MSEVALIYPHQLFKSSKILSECKKFYLIEDPLFFKEFKFHKHKLILHRASMKYYEDFLIKKKKAVVYIDQHELEHSGDISKLLKKDKVTEVQIYDLADDWLEKRVKKALSVTNIDFVEIASPLFFTDQKKAIEFLGEKIFFTSFYKKQREEHEILLNKDGSPKGGKLTYDSDNRKKLPKDLVPPKPLKIVENEYVVEAKTYVNKHFKKNYGDADNFNYAVTHAEARKIWLYFLKNKFKNFGDYQDAIHDTFEQNYHAIISPYLNNGLLDVVGVIAEAEKADIPLNAKEGFIRQILGWREFMYAVYRKEGVKIRNSNFFKHKNKIGEEFYTGDTGIAPIDDCINRTIKNCYLHHIERLMLLGNFMLLTKKDPDEVYRWFMELFIDAYDWVMVANSYSMSQYSDGGLITTKPYISSANYILKMSNYKKADWCEDFTALYWSFHNDHKKLLGDNARLKFSYATLNKMDKTKLKDYQKKAKKLIGAV